MNSTSKKLHSKCKNFSLYAIRECNSYATIIQFLSKPFNFIHACNLLSPYTLGRIAITNFSFKLKSNIDRVVTLFHRTLVNVDISQCKNIRDTDISPFNMCKKLKNVNINGCQAITDKGIKALASSCQQLTNINLYNCHLVTDEGIKALASSCQQLTNINLYNCTKKDQYL